MPAGMQSSSSYSKLGTEDGTHDSSLGLGTSYGRRTPSTNGADMETDLENFSAQSSLLTNQSNRIGMRMSATNSVSPRHNSIDNTDAGVTLSIGTSPEPTAIPSSVRIGRPKARMNWKFFDQGLRFGCMLTLLFWVLWDCIVDAHLRSWDVDHWIQLVFPVYRGLACFLLLGWCFVVSLFVWEHYGINYHFLFEVNSRNFISLSSAIDECTVCTIAYLLNFLLYFKILRGDFPPWIRSGYLPALYCIFLTLRLIPIGYWLGFSRNSRTRFIWAALVQVFILPFGKVNFLTIYLGDIMTSMVRVLVDLAYTGCFFISGDWLVDIESILKLNLVLDHPNCFQAHFFRRAIIPLLSVMPLWFRFMQCLTRYVHTRKRWPHIANACKYALAHSVVLFGVYNGSFQGSEESIYRAAWLVSMVFSTIYTFLWDVYIDWGLGNLRYGFLREQRLYPSRMVYYLAIGADLFLRFTWTLTLIPQGESSPVSPDFVIYLQPSLAVGELLRRTMWGFFRVEWEHLSTQSLQVEAEVPKSPENSTPEMSGTKVLLEVVMLVFLVLSFGSVAMMTAGT